MAVRKSVPVQVTSFANPEKLSDSEALYNFGLQRKIMLVCGIWPVEDSLERRWYLKSLIVINLVVLALCIVGEFLHGLNAYRDGNLNEVIESICPTVARISAFFRIVFYVANEKKIRRVLSDIDHAIRNQHPRERVITERVAYVGHCFTYCLILMMFFAALLYGVTPFLIMAYSWHQGQTPLVKLLPFKLALPYDSQDTLFFVLTTLFLNYASVPTITSQGSDALFSGVCLYVQGQLKGIKLDMEALATSEFGRSFGEDLLRADSLETRHVNRELRRISVRHQQIIELIDDVRTAFSPNVLLVYSGTALIICIVCIAMLIVEGLYKLTYLPYAVAELVLLFLCSYSGTIIRDSSEAIHTVAYNFPWYRYNRDTRHLIQMMMIRAQHGSNLDVPFFETSMATFSTIVRSASSYITLMKSFL
ncbi:AGAP002639-PA-like protein [Anopheles sinensis]|uniref:AGAP002639-PA-like protein n=1 Tax=Anopheles sinensis TaxID=74873 RepID=A0A084WUS7_ANOSI|nr:AGAP002639-PA-like protein [Anopheles sinensis]